MRLARDLNYFSVTMAALPIRAAATRTVTSVKAKIRKMVLALAPQLQRIVAERDQLLAASVAERSDWTKHRPFVTLNVEPAIGAGTSADDKRIVERLLQAYRQAPADQYGAGSMWRDFFDTHHKSIHETFMSGDVNAARGILSNPAASNLFYGFDELGAAFVSKYHNERLAVASGCKDNLLRLAEAIGAYRIECSEHGPWLANARTPTDEVLQAIESALGAQVSFPDIYAGAVGDRSSRGIVTYRAVQALYLAFRVRQVVQSGSEASVPAVCEIGAGLGRTALYASQLGIRNYTLVDVPMTLISQGYFLMRCLGEDAVVLPGETRRGPGQIRLMHPGDFFVSTQRFDLVANVDSLTEMGEGLPARYLKKIAEVSPAFLSINHECNPGRLSELLGSFGGHHALSRYPYWMRHGYVEELVRFRS